MMDVLSDVLRSVRLTGAVFFDVDAGVPWAGGSPGTAEIASKVMPGVEHVISFHAVMSGSCWAALTNTSAPPERLNGGDVVVFPGGAPNVMSSSPGAESEVDMSIYYRPVGKELPFTLIQGGEGGERTRFVCGYLGCDARPFNPLLGALPEMMCVRRPDDGAGWATDFIRHALEEGAGRRVGRETVLAKLSEVMFVEIVRRYVETLPADARGWLSGLRDAHVGKALQLIHARPAETWTMEKLARDVGLSRTTFASRFADYIGLSPMRYLAKWRIQQARRLLEQPDMSIAQAGAEVGYESEAAFSRAFKRLVGIPPGTWRKGRSIK